MVAQQMKRTEREKWETHADGVFVKNEKTFRTPTKLFSNTDNKLKLLNKM